MSTVGYGDMLPITDQEHTFVIISMLASTAIFAYVLTYIGEIILDMNRDKDAYKKELHLLNHYLEKKNINSELKAEAVNLFAYKFKIESNLSIEDEKYIIDRFPIEMQMRIQLQSNIQIINKCKLFSRFSTKVKESIAMNLKEVEIQEKQIIYSPSESEENYSFYFIESGQIEVFTHLDGGSSRTVAILEKNDSFGEFSFLTNEKRYSGTRALCRSNMFHLRRSDFLDLVKKNIEDYELFCMLRDSLVLPSVKQNLVVWACNNQTCHYCKSQFHDYKKCPYLHYIPDTTKIILQHNFNKDQERASTRLRDHKPYKLKYDAYVNFESLNKFVQKYIAHLQNLEAQNLHMQTIDTIIEDYDDDDGEDDYQEEEEDNMEGEEDEEEDDEMYIDNGFAEYVQNQQQQYQNDNDIKSFSDLSSNAALEEDEHNIYEAQSPQTAENKAFNYDNVESNIKRKNGSINNNNNTFTINITNAVDQNKSSSQNESHSSIQLHKVPNTHRGVIRERQTSIASIGQKRQSEIEIQQMQQLQQMNSQQHEQQLVYRYSAEKLRSASKTKIHINLSPSVKQKRRSKTIDLKGMPQLQFSDQNRIRKATVAHNGNQIKYGSQIRNRKRMSSSSGGNNAGSIQISYLKPYQQFLPNAINLRTPRNNNTNNYNFTEVNFPTTPSSNSQYQGYQQQPLQQQSWQKISIPKSNLKQPSAPSSPYLQLPILSQSMNSSNTHSLINNSLYGLEEYTISYQGFMYNLTSIKESNYTFTQYFPQNNFSPKFLNSQNCKIKPFSEFFGKYTYFNWRRGQGNSGFLRSKQKKGTFKKRRQMKNMKTEILKLKNYERLNQKPGSMILSTNNSNSIRPSPIKSQQKN